MKPGFRPTAPFGLSLSKPPRVLSLPKELSLSKPPRVLSLPKELSLSKPPRRLRHGAFDQLSPLLRPNGCFMRPERRERGMDS